MHQPRETPADAVVERFALDVARLGWASAVWVGGSLATGDYRPGVSDLDLVVLTDGPVDATRRQALGEMHARYAAEDGPARLLGAVWVDHMVLDELDRAHPTWTHGRLVERPLSRIARAELHRAGYAVAGPSPAGLLPAPGADDVRDAVRSELGGYWRWAVRRPWLWLESAQADLGLTTTARATAALDDGRLLTKGEALDRLAGLGVPAGVVRRVRARRTGADEGGNPLTRVVDAATAWRLCRRLVRDNA